MAPGKLDATETVLQAIDVTVVECVHAAIFERGYESSDGKKGKIESRRDAEISAGTETSVYAGCADEDRWVEASSGGGRSLREGRRQIQRQGRRVETRRVVRRGANPAPEFYWVTTTVSVAV